MTNHAQIKTTHKKYILIGVTLFVLVFIVAALELTNSINIFGQQQTAPQPTSEPIAQTNTPAQSTINLSPSTEEDNKESNERKNNPETQKPQSTTATVSVTTASVASDLLRIRALVNGTTEGTCQLRLTQNQLLVEKSANIVLKGTVYTCDGFDIALSEFTAKGTWDYTLQLQTTAGVSNQEKGQVNL